METETMYEMNCNKKDWERRRLLFVGRKTRRRERNQQEKSTRRVSLSEAQGGKKDRRGDDRLEKDRLEKE